MEEEQNQTSLIGASENETLMKESAWISGWADIMMTDLRAAYSIISNVVSSYGIRADNKPHDDRVNLDGMTCMLVGLMDRLDHDFHFRVVKTEDKHPIPWQSISSGIKSIYNQSRKTEQIPVDKSICKEMIPTSKIDDIVRAAIGELIKNIITSSNKMQNIINAFYAPKTGADATYFKVQLDTVDREGNIVALKDLNLDQIINEQVTKIFAEIKKDKEEVVAKTEVSATADKLTPKQNATPETEPPAKIKKLRKKK